MEKKENKILSFIKQRIFFNVPKEDKEYVRRNIMKNDHNLFRAVLIVIFILQISMILYKLIANSSGLEKKDLYYVICYTVLAGCCIIAFFLSEYFYNKNNPKGYFIIIAIMVDLIFTWALGISLLDSTRGTELTTYAYTTVAIAAIVILEPWVFIFDSVIWCTALCLCVNFIPELKMYTSVIISSVSIAILISVISIINFIRRIDSIMLQREVSDLNKELSDQSHIDALTGIYNRRYLTEHINETLNLGITPSGVMMFDIDDFKKVNDDFGHHVGDDCLIAIGSLVREFVKAHKNCYAVRYGGEEFLVFFARTDRMNLLKEAEEFKNKVSEQVIKAEEGIDVSLTISIGIALAKPGQNYSGLINKADACLYSAKRTGKNKVCFE